jgi:hypothetical protein
MVGKLGIVVLCLAALTACTPGVYEGRVIAGLDENGALVAVLGTCDDDEVVELNIFEDTAEVPEMPPGSTQRKRDPQWFARADTRNRPHRCGSNCAASGRQKGGRLSSGSCLTWAR